MTHEELINIFDYHPDGYFIDKGNRRRIKKGKIVAGWIEKGGYRRLYVLDRTYLLHRLIFFYHNGFIPEYPNQEIDHIDRDKLNNRIENLRICSKNGNMQNKIKSKNTSSKYRGVFYSNNEEKWKCGLTVNFIRHHIGTFENEKEAACIL